MHNEGDIILALICPSMMKAIMTIGRDREPPKARLSLMRKSVTRGANTEAHLLGAWDTMP